MNNLYKPSKDPRDDIECDYKIKYLFVELKDVISIDINYDITKHAEVVRVMFVDRSGL